MQKDQNLIIVKGNGRNVGKTEFICRLIEKVSKWQTVVGLKVSSIAPAIEEKWGGCSSQIFEELVTDNYKDTSLMLQSGASRALYIQEDGTNLSAAYLEVKSMLDKDTLIICESNSLAQHIQPELLIMVQPQDNTVTSSHHDAIDLLVSSKGQGGFPELELIQRSGSGKWYVKKQ